LRNIAHILHLTSLFNILTHSIKKVNILAQGYGGKLFFVIYCGLYFLIFSKKVLTRGFFRDIISEPCNRGE
jgi:hypothetical protein